MRDNGIKTPKKVWVSRTGLIPHISEVLMLTARKMVSVNINGKTGLHMKEIGLTVKLMDSVLTDGQTIASLPVSGSIVKSEDLVYIHGLMEDVTKASSPETRDKGTVST